MGFIVAYLAACATSQLSTADCAAEDCVDTEDCPDGLCAEEEPSVDRRLKILLLVGQSNMVGYGYLRAPTDDPSVRDLGTLDHYLAQGELSQLRPETDGPYVVRDDVWHVFRHHGDSAWLSEALTVGQGGDAGLMGPELGFGLQLGDHYDEAPVLLLKVAEGGKSLYADFRPPSSGPTGFAGGPMYQQVVSTVDAVTTDLHSYYPDYDGEGFEIVALAWHQAWNDFGDGSLEYEDNFRNLLGDLRRDLQLPDLPFIVGQPGHAVSDPYWWANEQGQIISDAQEAVCTSVEFSTGCRFVDTTHAWVDPALSPRDEYTYHWNGNAKSYFVLGEAMGLATRALLSEREADPE